MRLRPEPITIVNPDDVMKECLQFGFRSQHGYAAGEKEFSRHRAVRQETLENLRVQAMGRAGECAYCIHRKLSIKLLDWGSETDHGWDVDDEGKLVDIKTTRKQGYLIWPKTQVDKLTTKHYDILVAVYGGRWFYKPYIPEFTLYGWVTRARFLAEHLTAVAGDDSELDPGTLFMRARNLDDMRTLMPGWGGYCRECGAKGLYVIQDTILLDKPYRRWLWFCEEHRPLITQVMGRRQA